MYVSLTGLTICKNNKIGTIITIIPTKFYEQYIIISHARRMNGQWCSRGFSHRC